MIYCEKAEFGQISRSLSLNSGAIRLKRPKNLTQIGIPSLRSVKSDRLLERLNFDQASWMAAAGTFKAETIKRVCQYALLP